MPPIYDEKSDLFRDYLADEDPREAPLTKARYYAATGNITIAADALTDSRWLLAELPAECILHEETFFDVENLALAAVRIGTADDVEALVSQTQATENTVTPIEVGDANHGKRLWEVLGLAENPGGHIPLYLHAIAGSTGAGSMPFRLSYLWN